MGSSKKRKTRSEKILKITDAFKSRLWTIPGMFGVF